MIGVGPGRGLGLLFFLTGIFNVSVLVAGALHPRIRHVEDELPDAVGAYECAPATGQSR